MPERCRATLRREPAEGNSGGSGEADRTRVGKRAPKRGAAREAKATPPAAPERRFVDIDPWAVLLEGLMTTPDEEPAERKGGKRE